MHSYGFVSPIPLLRVEIPNDVTVAFAPSLTMSLLESNHLYHLTSMIVLEKQVNIGVICSWMIS